MMLVMIRGSVTVETLPVNVSIPQVLENNTGMQRKDWEKRTPRADMRSLKHSPSGCVCRARVKEVVVVAAVTNGKTVR
jgi:hypothetical protein